MIGDGSRRWRGGRGCGRRRCACDSHRLISRDLRRVRTRIPAAPHRLHPRCDRAMSPYTRHSYVLEYFFSFMKGCSPENLQ